MAIATKQPDGDDEGGDDAGIFAEINITPLTDVFLVMVVIFMVSALAQVDSFQKKEQAEQAQEEAEKKSGLKLNLPEGKAQELDSSKESLVIEIPLQGDVVVGGKPMNEADLDKILGLAYQRDKKTQVVIKADKGVSHGRVVNVMERAKGKGLTQLAIGTSSGG